jgi:hypothetical protein
MTKLGQYKPGETDEEWGNRLIVLGQKKQRQAEKYRQEGQFNLYSAKGRSWWVVPPLVIGRS